MFEAVHSVMARTPWDKAFRLCSQVDAWPTFMPAVRAARTLIVGDGFDVVEITAEAGHEVWTWKSRRSLDPVGQRIRIRRLDPRPPLVCMEGEWVFKAIKSNVTLITLVHRYELVADAATNWMAAIIHRNAVRDLEALRHELEGI